MHTAGRHSYSGYNTHGAFHLMASQATTLLDSCVLPTGV